MLFTIVMKLLCMHKINNGAQANNTLPSLKCNPAQLGKICMYVMTEFNIHNIRD